MKRAALITLACLLLACADKPAPTPVILPENCQAAYVILPGNFVIDIVGEAEVRLNPAAHQFELFCAAPEARKRLSGLDASDAWKVYELEGAFSELAIPCGQNQFCLAAPTRVKDWLE